ncbi:MAG: hypothetical protein HKL89_00550 [Candidatus Dormibacteraeota bacterium]|nr:hypothetical protein [Candidatus Dormibacteraeota bacterium]
MMDWLSEINVLTLVTRGRFDEASPAHMRVLAAGVAGAEMALFRASSQMAFDEERDTDVQRVRAFLRTVDGDGNSDI